MLTFLFCLNVLSFMLCEDYKNENGSVLYYSEDETKIKIIKRHEQDVQIGEYVHDFSRIIYDNYNDLNIIGTLKIGDTVTVKEIFILTDKSEDTESMWLKINFNIKMVGFIWVKI